MLETNTTIEVCEIVIITFLNADTDYYWKNWSRNALKSLKFKQGLDKNE